MRGACASIKVWVKVFMKLWICLCSIIAIFLCGGCQPHAFAPTSGARGAVKVATYDGYAGQGKTVWQNFVQAPQKVLAVSEPVVDNLIFLGVQDRIVAVSECPVDKTNPNFALYKNFAYLTHGYGYPSKEAVLGLRPDLIIGWGSLFGDSALGSVTYWHGKNIHTYVMSNTVPTRASDRTVANIVTDLQNLAKIFRVEEANAAAIAKLKTRIDKLKQDTDCLTDKERPTAVTVQYVYGNEYYGRTATDLTADIIKLAGGKSLDDIYGGRKSVEHLIKSNPDFILVVDMPRRPAAEKIKALKANRILGRVKAIKNNNFFVIPYRTFYCGSEQTVTITEKLRDFIKRRQELM